MIANPTAAIPSRLIFRDLSLQGSGSEARLDPSLIWTGQEGSVAGGMHAAILGNSLHPSAHLLAAPSKRNRMSSLSGPQRCLLVLFCFEVC